MNTKAEFLSLVAGEFTKSNAPNKNAPVAKANSTRSNPKRGSISDESSVPSKTNNVHSTSQPIRKKKRTLEIDEATEVEAAPNQKKSATNTTPSTPLTRTQLKNKQEQLNLSSPDIINQILNTNLPENPVKVYDDCDDIRLKIANYLTLPNMSSKQLAPYIGVTPKAIEEYLTKSGTKTGIESEVYTLCYIFFEKMRIFLKQGRSLRRMTHETHHPNGFVQLTVATSDDEEAEAEAEFEVNEVSREDMIPQHEKLKNTTLQHSLPPSSISSVSPPPSTSIHSTTSLPPIPSTSTLSSSPIIFPPLTDLTSLSAMDTILHTPLPSTKIIIYDSCDIIREKLNAFLVLPNMSKHRVTHILLGKQPSEQPDTTLDTFLAMRGPFEGQSFSIYYYAYILFEKIRLYLRQEKSPLRRMLEAQVPQGYASLVLDGIVVPTRREEEERENRKGNREVMVIGSESGDEEGRSHHTVYTRNGHGNDHNTAGSSSKGSRSSGGNDMKQSDVTMSSSSSSSSRGGGEGESTTRSLHMNEAKYLEDEIIILRERAQARHTRFIKCMHL